MIVATRIPNPTEQMRLATIRAAARRIDAGSDQQLIDELERRGYRVTRLPHAA